MPKKPLTAADKRRFSALHGMGCVVCGAEPQIHHLTGAGMALKAPHSDTIPLCGFHHTGPAGIHQVGVETWEATYGRQEALLQRVNRRLGHVRADTI